MNKLQFGLLIGAVVLSILLYQLPKVVVENDKLTDPTTSAQDNHNIAMPPELLSSIKLWRAAYKEKNIEKKINFADSLASAYLKYQLTDSAMHYINDMARLAETRAVAYRAAELTYNVFETARSQEEAKRIAELAAERINALLADKPNDSRMKNMLAMTLVVSEQPMQGVLMLRELVQENPDDLTAIKNLGVLSIQSGQYDKAEERFRDLLSRDSTNLEALFYLGIALSEQGVVKGKTILEKLAQNNENPAIQSLAAG